jgi:hypothetical protein
MGVINAGYTPLKPAIVFLLNSLGRVYHAGAMVRAYIVYAEQGAKMEPEELKKLGMGVMTMPDPKVYFRPG